MEAYALQIVQKYKTAICLEKYLIRTAPRCTLAWFHIFSGKTIFLKGKKKIFFAEIVGSAPQMPDNQQSLMLAKEAYWQNCPFHFLPMFTQNNMFTQNQADSKYFGLEIEL